MLLYAEKEKAMKHIANMLTGLRIVLSLLIPVFLDDRTAVFILFVAAGLTDLLDGIIARRTGTASRLGAGIYGEVHHQLHRLLSQDRRRGEGTQYNIGSG